MDFTNFRPSNMNIKLEWTQNGLDVDQFTYDRLGIELVNHIQNMIKKKMNEVDYLKTELQKQKQSEQEIQNRLNKSLSDYIVLEKKYKHYFQQMDNTVKTEKKHNEMAENTISQQNEKIHSLEKLNNELSNKNIEYELLLSSNKRKIIELEQKNKGILSQNELNTTLFNKKYTNLSNDFEQKNNQQLKLECELEQKNKLIDLLQQEIIDFELDLTSKKKEFKLDYDRVLYHNQEKDGIILKLEQKVKELTDTVHIKQEAFDSLLKGIMNNSPYKNVNRVNYEDKNNQLY